MSSDRRLERVEAFQPLRPVPRRRLIVRVVIAPLIWVAALVVAAVIVEQSFAIQLGLIVAFAAVAVSFVVLSLLRSLRDRERRRDVVRR